MRHFLKIRNRSNLVGIYVYLNGVLELFPYYIGRPTPHKIIPLDKGLCGATFREGKTLIVNDVTRDERYLACSEHTKSEIVVPIRNDEGEIIGEIDIDSDYIDAFNETDKSFLENVANEISSLVKRYVELKKRDR